MDTKISVIIPAYNEAQRLPAFLVSVRDYLDNRHTDRYEVIVVDDGSRDGLREVLKPVEAVWPQLVVMQHETNRGKGAAVRTGMLAARGRLLLFADADGATPIEEEARLAAAIEAGADVAIGSRLADTDDVRCNRTWTRGLAGRVFAALARRCLRVGVRDTQCGFKMFLHDAGRKLFSLSRETGYLLDLELLALADRLDYRVEEVPVNWQEVPGGHMNIVRDSVSMFLGLLRLRSRLRHRS
jgi:dolichyl-phosphate beta-glucosyltransferase